MNKIMKLFDFLKSHKEGIDRVSPWFLMTYFIFNSFPYIFARIPAINSIFTNSLIAFLIRFGFLLLYAILGIAIMICHRIKINWIVLVGLLFLFVLFVVTIFISPNTITYYSFYFTGKISINDITLGTYTKLVHIARFWGDIVVFFFLVFSYPHSLKNRNQITYIIMPAVVIATIGVFYTFIFERNNLFSIISGGSTESINSIFHSKNAYGIFLFNGAAAITFIFFADSRKWFKILGLLQPVFLIMSFLIDCKLAAVCITLLFILTYVYSIFRYFKTRPYISFSLLGIALIASLSLVLLFTVPSLRNNEIISKIYTKIVESLSNINISSFIGRTGEWAMVPRMTNGIYMWIGFSTPAGYQLITSYTSINASASLSVYDLHNAYVDFYAYHGIIGCLLLGLFYIYICYLIIKLYKKNKTMSLLVAVVLISSILYGMAETYRLFLSMSANTFALNIMIIVTLQFELKDDTTIFRPNIIFRKAHKNKTEVACSE